MKKRTCIICSILLSLALAGCGGADNGTATVKKSGSKASVNDVLKSGMEAENNKKEAGQKASDQASDPQASDSVTPSSDNASKADAASAPGKDSKTDATPGKDSKNGNSSSPAEGVDVDLTALSSTMVYSEVYNMMTTPNVYIGKTIRMSGLCNIYHDEETGNYYYTCIIQDATACCAQGIEFVLTADYACPGDYPEQGDTVCVTGTFDTYMEGDYMYCTLREAKLS